MPPLARLQSVRGHRFWKPDARTAPKVLLEMPDHVTPNCPVDSKRGKQRR